MQQAPNGSNVARIGIVILGLIASLSGHIRAEATPECVGTPVGPGDNLQAAVTNAAAGETLCISGSHRVTQVLQPKDGMTLEGTGDAVIDGSSILATYFKRNNRFVFPNQTRNSSLQKGRACENYPRNCYFDGVFLDGVALFHVPMTKLGPGRYHFNYKANEIVLADNPLGRTVELTQAHDIIRSTASGVTLKDLTVENAAGRGIMAEGPGWKILNVESRWNHAVGINTNGDDFLIQGGHYHHNGQYGFTGSGDRGVIEGVESDHNDHLRFGTSLTNSAACWDAGESKWVYTVDMIVRDNFVHDGFCNGLWFDVNNINATAENNTIVNNRGIGLIQEISYGGVLRFNKLSGNGFYNIEVASSSNIEVYGNEISGGNAIYLLQQTTNGVPRSGSCPSWDPYPCQHLTENVSIHDNITSCPTEICAGVNSRGISEFFTRNSISGNTYNVSTVETSRWRIDKGGVSLQTWQEKGFDMDSVFVPSVLPSPSPSSIPDSPSPSSIPETSSS